MISRTISLALVGLLLVLPFSHADCHNECGDYGVCVENACVCIGHWGGDDCSVYDQYLNSGEVSLITVGQAQWRFYRHTVGSGGVSLIWWVNQTNEAQDCDLYLQFEDYPSLSKYSERNISTGVQSSIIQDAVPAGIQYAGVYGYTECSFSISVTEVNGCVRGCSEHGTCVDGTCACEHGYGGSHCEHKYLELKLGETTSARVDASDWEYFHTPIVHGTTFQYVVDQSDDTAADCDLYVAFDRLPTLWDWDYSNVTMEDVSTIEVSSSKEGRYVLGVYGFLECAFSVSVVEILEDGGCHSKCSLHGDCNSEQACDCKPGFSGDDCEWMDPGLLLSHPQGGYVAKNVWNFYNARVITQNSLVITVDQMMGDCDVYVRGDDKPTHFEFDYLDLTLHDQIRLAIRQPGDVTWYIGVYGWEPCEYSLTITEEVFCDCGLDNPHGTCAENGVDCICELGWSGHDCSVPLAVLKSGEVINGNVTKYGWKYFEFLVDDTTTGIVSLKERETVGLLWMFVSFTAEPTLAAYDLSNKENNNPYHEISIEVAVPQTRTVYVGVYGNPFGLHDDQSIPFDLVAWTAPF